MNMFQRIDIFFSKSINVLLRFFLHLSLLVMGGIYVAAFFVVIFEYDEAFADLANIEILILGLLVLLLYRHYRYCRYFNVGIWKLISSPIYALGMLNLVSSVIWAMVVTVLIFVNPELKLAQLLQFSKEDELVALGLFIIAIYLSTPTKEVQTKRLDADPDRKEEQSSSPDLSSSRHVDNLINKTLKSRD